MQMQMQVQVQVQGQVHKHGRLHVIDEVVAHVRP